MATTTVDKDGDDNIDMVDNSKVVNDQKTSDIIDIVDLMDDESESSESSDSSKDEKSDEEKISEKQNSSTNHVSKDNDVINNQNGGKDCEENDFILLLKSNNLMNRVIHKCLNMGDNKGMQSVINRTLLPLYKNADSSFKKSESFLNILRKILLNLKHDPSHKFSHIKSLCEELKNSKKVAFVTLTTDINKTPQHRKSERLVGRKKNSKFSDLKKARERRKNQKSGEKTDIIDLDHCDDDKDIAFVDIVDSDDAVDEIVLVDTNHDETLTSNKENYKIGKDMYLEEDRPRLDSEKDTNEIYVADNLRNEKPSTVKDFNNRVSDVDQTVYESMEGISDQLKKAMEIEKKIQNYKTLVDELDEQEVTNNSGNSPYLKSDKYKSMIVKLYKQLCKLTGYGDVSFVKQRVIRLHVSQGHSPGPVRRLEQYLNNTMDKMGFIPLPDFHDVLRCVRQSNIVDQLGWDSRQIMNEAMALFTQCGNALRKNRQKREYKDLMNFVGNKSLEDYDPANMDPLLSARLEENKRVATVKEYEILDRYANMEYTSRFNKSRSTNIRIEQANSDSDSEIDAKREKIDNTNHFNTSSKNKKNIKTVAVNSQSNREILKEVESIVTEPSTHFMMPVISGTCSLSKINTDISQTTSNIINQSCPYDQTHPIVNQINPNLGVHPIISPILNTFMPPLIYTTPSLQAVSNGVPNFPIMTILPATAKNYPSQFINETVCNIQRRANNVATSNEIEDNGSIVEVIENSFKTLSDNISKQNIFTRDYDNLVQNNLNDNNTGHIEIIENSTGQIEVKEENEIDDSNANSIHNFNIPPYSNFIGIDNQISKDAMGTKDNDSNICVDNRERNASTPNSGTISVEEAPIKEEPIDTQCNMLKGIHEAQTNSVETNVNTLHSNGDLTKNNITESISSNLNSDIVTKIRVISIENLRNTIERKDIGNNENAQTLENVTVKKEAITKHSHEIQRLLDGLGDSYISTIFDIEDPFLVVEISSDSSSDDDL